MWIELTGYPTGIKYIVNTDKIVIVEQFLKDYSVITISLEDGNFIQVKETYEKIKTLLSTFKK